MQAYPIISDNEREQLKVAITRLSGSYSYACILDSCNCPPVAGRGTYDLVAGFGSNETAATDPFDIPGKAAQTWTFGYLSYDLKNQVENLVSANTDTLDFPDASFFSADLVLFVKNNELVIISPNPQAVYEQLKSGAPDGSSSFRISNQHALTSKEKYLAQLERIKEYLMAGDIYEINYCIEFAADAEIEDPGLLWLNLLEISPAPFAGFYKAHDRYILSASPERYLSRNGSTLFSQPIKGTAARGSNKEEDNINKEELFNSEKERAENVMIVDLVRNDLSRVCAAGTVKVDELFGIYSYSNVHQMISTVSGELLPGKTNTDALKASFPMGSMTGAPKIRAMEIIEELEDTRRGPYSGALGYFSPDGNFDLNVLIRSVFYNESMKKLKFNAGGAITFDSEPLKEYDEVILKLSTIKKLLGIENL